MTSAPWSARIIVASGPETFDVKSTTRYPCKGPGITWPFRLVRKDNQGSDASACRRPGEGRDPSLRRTLAFAGVTIRACTGALLMKPRFDLFAQEAQRGHDLLVRNQTAAIQLCQDAVDAELFLQIAQALRHCLRGTDQDLAGQCLLVGQFLEASEPLCPPFDRPCAGAS